MVIRASKGAPGGCLGGPEAHGDIKHTIHGNDHTSCLQHFPRVLLAFVKGDLAPSLVLGVFGAFISDAPEVPSPAARGSWLIITCRCAVYVILRT